LRRIDTDQADLEWLTRICLGILGAPDESIADRVARPAATRTLESRPRTSVTKRYSLRADTVLGFTIVTFKELQASAYVSHIFRQPKAA
jgi:hypothetical protein